MDKSLTFFIITTTFIGVTTNPSLPSIFFLNAFFPYLFLFLNWNIDDLTIVLGLGVQQSDSVMCAYIAIFFQILSSYRLLQNIKYSALCYIVDPCWLSILYVVVHDC